MEAIGPLVLTLYAMSWIGNPSLNCGIMHLLLECFSTCLAILVSTLHQAACGTHCPWNLHAFGVKPNSFLPPENKEQWIKFVTERYSSDSLLCCFDFTGHFAVEINKSLWVKWLKIHDLNIAAIVTLMGPYILQWYNSQWWWWWLPPTILLLFL